MSSTTTPSDTPIGTPIQPLHNPAQAAHVSVPQAPLGNATNGKFNQAPGMAAKALFAKKFASHNPTYVSPTDSMMTPVSQKLNASKKKHFAKGAAKPMPSLFGQPQKSEDSDTEETPEQSSVEPSSAPAESKMDEDENPF